MLRLVEDPSTHTFSLFPYCPGAGELCLPCHVSERQMLRTGGLIAGVTSEMPEGFSLAHSPLSVQVRLGDDLFVLTFGPW